MADVAASVLAKLKNKEKAGHSVRLFLLCPENHALGAWFQRAYSFAYKKLLCYYE